MTKLHYVYKEGKNNNLIITLHGTGGSADDLFSIASYVDRDAHLLGIEGQITENGLKRYFKRYSDGGFDKESLEKETKILYENISNLITKYQLTDLNLNIIGYSNGANILVSILKTYQLDKAFIGLLHPSIGIKEQEFIKQPNIEVLVTSGNNDPFISESELKYFKQQLEKANIKNNHFIHEEGHSIINPEILKLKEVYTELAKKNE